MAKVHKLLVGKTETVYRPFGNIVVLLGKIGDCPNGYGGIKWCIQEKYPARAKS